MTGVALQLGVDSAADQVMVRLREGRLRVWVVGTPATGRSRLVSELVARLEGNAVVLDLLEAEETDAAIGAVLVSAGWLPDQKRSQCMHDWPSVEAGLLAVSGQLSTSLTFVVKVPESWRSQTVPGSDWSHHAQVRARELIRGLSRVGAPVVWITSRAMQPRDLELDLQDDTPAPIPLPAPRNTRALLDGSCWSSYSQAAYTLGRALKLTKEELNPVCLRLGVGAVALGVKPSIVAPAMSQPFARAVAELTDLLAGRLARPEHASVRAAIQRLLLARRPIKRAAAARCTDIPDDHLPLVTDCVGYGEDAIKVSAAVRTRLRSQLGELEVDETETAHQNLSDHFKSLDGADDVSATFKESTSAWLEKEYHRAHAGEIGNLEYLPARELYWERGRYLSVVRKSWAKAATVYEACVDRFPDDAYAWHYLGFNLERAGQDRRRAEQAYRKAIEIDPENAWWNGRLVRSLITRGKPVAAQKAWSECLENVDPEGTRIGQSPWLAEQVHGLVVRAWLDAGSARHAFDALKLIPDDVIEASVELQNLREEVLDAVEADALGESVYPKSVPVALRWRDPRHLPTELGGGKRVRWYPGRVVTATKESVRILYAERDEATGTYRSMVTEFGGAEWQGFLLGPPERASSFVELGVYERGGELIRHVVNAEDDAPQSRRLPPLAYFDRWRSQR